MSWSATRRIQMTHETLDEISDEEWDYTFRLNVGRVFLSRQGRAPAHERRVVGYRQLLGQLRHAVSDVGALRRDQGRRSPTSPPAWRSCWAEKGIRVNSVAPGPIWTPLIPSTMPAEKVASFGENTPLGRAGQPAELAPVYVLLASDEGSYISGARVAVTGGRPIL